MNPFYALFLLVRTIFPYLKEAWFRDGSFRYWVKDNKTTIAWVFFKIVLLVLIFYLINTLMALSARLTEYRRANAGLAYQNKQLVKQIQTEKATSKKYKDQLDTSNGQLTVYNRWFFTCDIEPPSSTVDTACPVTQSPPPRPKVRQRPVKPKTPTVAPAEDTQKPTLRERLRRIFQREAK